MTLQLVTEHSLSNQRFALVSPLPELIGFAPNVSIDFSVVLHKMVFRRKRLIPNWFGGFLEVRECFQFSRTRGSNPKATNPNHQLRARRNMSKVRLGDICKNNIKPQKDNVQVSFARE